MLPELHRAFGVAFFESGNQAGERLAAGRRGEPGPGQQISGFDPSQSQETANGFLFPYGDYTGLIMNTTCTTPAPAMAWGEGHNWQGGATAPGHIEFASFC